MEKTYLISNTTFNIIVYTGLIIAIVYIIKIVNTINKNKRYKVWKKDTIKIFGLINCEYERNDDKFIQELFDENEKLSAENTLLKMEIAKVSNRSLILLIISIISLKFNGKNK